MMSNQKNNYDSQLTYIGRLIKEYRLSNCLTQDELAKESELNVNTVIRVEKGFNTSLITIMKLADALMFEMKELFIDMEY